MKTWLFSVEVGKAERDLTPKEEALITEMAGAMYVKLSRKPNTYYWDEKAISIRRLSMHFHEEIVEFEEDLSWSEAADIANIAAMLADRKETEIP